MKKKLLSLLLVAVMALSLVACGGNKEEESGNAEVKDTFTYSVFSDLGTTLHTATFRGHQGRVLRPDRAILSGQS